MTDEPKTVAFLLYPGFTVLDLVGPLQVFSSLAAFDPGYRVVVVGARIERWDTDTPLRITASHTFDQVPAPAVLVVPGGGVPTAKAAVDPELIGYVRSVAEKAEVMASVCTGSMILGAAGLLKGREATSHWSFVDLLSEFGATPVSRRWVEDGPVLTAAGVAAGIDMALHLVERFAGAEVAKQIQFGIEYDPEPPQGALDWEQAPRELWAGFREHMLREGLADSPELRDRLLHQS
ncbi:DJ-1/PfpI family protein [Amycolatopsis nigrescens]|uniref:DJ-1/PfpI family protein n=1 Tax=Amycolatopsis nigrescens TaxID=381445 RepID=UPI0003653EF5|nr:DJ-1/PfpI family protein [Amycolatopsis nigrescens]